MNVWALPVPLPGARNRQRFQRLLPGIARMDAEVVALQEVFDVGLRERMVAELGGSYHYTADAIGHRRFLGVGRADRTGGLLTLTRYPIMASIFKPHRLPAEARTTERLAAKGMQLVRVVVPGGSFVFGNLHLHAGGSARDARVRATQYAAIREALVDFAGDSLVILAGDFNVHQHVRPAGLQGGEIAQITSLGLVDALADGHAGRITYSRRHNRFARLWYSAARRDERYDYILYKPGTGWRVRVSRGQVVFTDPEDVVSDHYGVLADLEIQRVDGCLAGT